MAATDKNKPSYSEDDLPEFTPMQWYVHNTSYLLERSTHICSSRSLQEIRASIPAHLFERDTTRGLLYLSRDLLMGATAWKLATFIDPFFQGHSARAQLGPFLAETARWLSWSV